MSDTYRIKRESLPTNLESATREYVRSSLASWDEKILARRANRLGVSLEEASRVEAKPKKREPSGNLICKVCKQPTTMTVGGRCWNCDRLYIETTKKVSNKQGSPAKADEPTA